MKLLLATILLGAATAHADVSAAARAFSDGQAAQLEGNYERAAQSFELAYNIAPSKEALRSAVRARQQSGQLPRAATLAHVLLTQYPDDAMSAKLAAEVIAEAKGKLARIAVTCAPHCTLAVGGRAISLTAAPSHVVYANPGHEVLEVTFDGDRTVRKDIVLKAGDDLTLPIQAPPAAHTEPVPAPAASPGADHGLPPIVAIGGGVLTLALAGATVWSGLDTRSAHDSYVKMPTHDAFTAGQSKQLRTNILLGTTIAAGAATGAVALIWTRWHGGEHAPDIAVTPTSGGATLSFGGRF